MNTEMRTCVGGRGGMRGKAGGISPRTQTPAQGGASASFTHYFAEYLHAPLSRAIITRQFKVDLDNVRPVLSRCTQRKPQKNWQFCILKLLFCGFSEQGDNLSMGHMGVGAKWGDTMGHQKGHFLHDFFSEIFSSRSWVCSE